MAKADFFSENFRFLTVKEILHPAPKGEEGKVGTAEKLQQAESTIFCVFVRRILCNREITLI